METCCSDKSTACCCGSMVKITETSTKLTFNDILGTWKARWNIKK